jgi:hypothetical protein
MTNFTRLVLSAFLLLAGLTLSAEMLPDGGITIDEMSSILTKKGYKAEVKVYNDEGEKKIVSSAEGYKFAIYFYSLSDKGRAKNIQFCVSVDLKDGITLERAYQWNKEYRYARVYRDEEDDPIMEMDMDLEHGCTTEAVDNNLERWFSLLNTFDKFIHGQDD